ncbi:hypothetical protein C0214_23975 [Methylobacterium sp. DM1]|nr:hypothetical protein C0214_23975 [Methylobacterium sp. DM1]
MSKRYSWAVFRKGRPVPAALIAPRPISEKKITMPVRIMSDMTDAQCGLPDDPVAQQRAEEAIRAAIAYRLRHEAKVTKVQAVEITIADDELAISNVPADVLDGISAELRRISNRSGGPRKYSPIQA